MRKASLWTGRAGTNFTTHHTHMKVTENDFDEFTNTACTALRQAFQDGREKMLDSMNCAIADTPDNDPPPTFGLGFSIKIDLDDMQQKHKLSFKGPSITSESAAHITLEDDEQPELGLDDGGLKGAGQGDSGAPLEPEV